MTWSLIARDPATGQVGVAVATRFFAVGSLVPHVETGVGALASQAFVNPYYGRRGLAMMREGAGAETVVAALTGPDEGRAQRQLHVMDARGGFAAFTGEACVDWCGHAVDPHGGFSVAGNMLAGPAVIAETARAFAAAPGSLADRFLAALRAGEAAGGDKRGRQSAAILIHDGEEYPLLDIRVDDHADPLAELARLERVSRERFSHYRPLMPSRENPAGVTDRAEIDRRIAEGIAREAGRESGRAAG
jgi:uncharacterized Ntn-hydrolase superfamily protein